MYSQIAANSGDRRRSHCNLGLRLRFLVQLQHLDFLLGRGSRGGLLVTGISTSSLRTNLHAARPDKLTYCRSIQRTVPLRDLHRLRGHRVRQSTSLHGRINERRSRGRQPCEAMQGVFDPGKTGPRCRWLLQPRDRFFVAMCSSCTVSQARPRTMDAQRVCSMAFLLQGDGASVPRIKVLLKQHTV